MKSPLLILLLLHFYTVCWPQAQPNAANLETEKPPIDSAAIVNWPSLGGISQLSNNGKYFMYSIENQPPNSRTIIIQSTQNSWKISLTGAGNGFFSPDSKSFIFQSKDTLFSLSLGADHLNYITGIRSYKHYCAAKEGWLAYLLENNSEMVLKNLLTGKEERFPKITDYTFSPGEKSLLLQSKTNNGTAQLQWITLNKRITRSIWPSENTTDTTLTISNYQFDNSGQQLAFITSDTALWYYQEGMKTATRKFRSPDTLIQGIYFSNNNRYIFLQLQTIQQKQLSQPENGVQVDIWSYQDSVLPFKQQPPSQNQYTAVLSADGNNIIPIQSENEIILGSSSDYTLLQDRTDIPAEDYWWPSYKEKSYWLVSLKNGSRKRLCSIYDWSDISFSLHGLYLVYYDHSQKNYYSYQLLTGNTKNISQNLPAGIFEQSEGVYPFCALQPSQQRIAGWVGDNEAVLITDDYDIWQLDITGSKQPLNLTNGYGRAKNITFHLTDGSKPFTNNSPVLLYAFNNQNKYTGFYQLTTGKNQNPVLLTMAPCLQSIPLKAANANAWVVLRETSTQAPNYYFTQDLKNYTPLTNLQPQEKYNWLNTELVTWQQLDGTKTQGILYKPENFDPHKKYPLLFYYYEQLSQNMYKYLQPGFSDAIIDIPWYVSRGYLVFTPDIHYGIASLTDKVNGDYVVNSVVSAAQYLASLPFVDSKRIGIQGYSFGGGETLYLITHSDLFAAACAGASTVSNEITAYLGIIRAHGKPVGYKMLHSEAGHNKIGATLWQRPDLYIRASPIFRADKVSTPLLLMHNLGDPVCDWNQSAQMFMALRRLGKKVWFLQYDHGAHNVAAGKDVIDFTIRMQQFFDHYLKGAPAPRWMIKGIPVYLKGIETGLELDESNQIP